MTTQVNVKGETPAQLIERTIQKAIEERASDIHFQSECDYILVRFRIDGILYPIEHIGKETQPQVISRLKVLSQMNIAEHQFPQDGHFELTYQGKVYNIRVAAIPTTYGETIALRILNREDMIMKFDTIGFTQDQLSIFHTLIKNPFGIILITGPSGSGKTVLLYSILNILNKPEINMVTMEDPVELEMENIRQIQINESIGLTFSKVMRAVIRQDPNVIMVGEIRDPDTAQMTIQAALSGILVFSTFHTFDVPSLVTRLIEMGVPRSVVAHSVTGVISTRLARKICDSCKEGHQPSNLEKQMIGKELTLYSLQRGKGCDVCHQSGYLGRVGIYEVISFDDEIRSTIMDGKPFSELLQLLQKKSIKTLSEAAREKVLQGVTSMDEIIRVLGMPITQ